MAGDYRSISRRLSMVSKGNMNYEGIQSRYQKAEVSSRLTNDELREPAIPRPLAVMTLKDIAELSTPDSSMSGFTVVTSSSPMQDELLATSLSHMRIRASSREEVAERERQAIIREYQRIRALLNEDYWVTKTESELSQFERTRALSLREEFRKVIDQPVPIRAEVTQKHRASTELLRLRLIEDLEQQCERERSLEQTPFREKLRKHYTRYSDLYDMSLDTALATWVVEAGLG
ncbi:hypothetical protein N0V82_005788 [Gnomoniopsis sp. IMI 355080]|nr:hypothetical protein N0V82_005788 [Gnomoniopsis sp. IMI 355080]